MRSHILAAAVLAVLPIQMGCDLEAYLDSDRYREDFQYSYDLKPGGTFTVESFNGSIEILSWEKDSVQITGTKYAGTEADLRDIKIDAVAAEGGVRVRTIRPEGRRGSMGAKYFIRVPRKVALEQIATSNGSIRVEDIDGNARLQTSNGSVRLRKMAGRLDVRTSNGSIEAEDLDSEASLRTSNGAIRLGHVRGAVDAQTSNGSISLRLASPVPGRQLRFQTSNGSLDLEFQSLEGNDIRASTSNSSITLRLPEKVRAQVRARTSGGSIHSDFDVRGAGSEEKNEIEGTIGGGGPLLQLTTSHGAIRILRM